MKGLHYIADDLAQLEQGVGWASVAHVEDYLAKVAAFEAQHPERDTRRST